MFLAHCVARQLLGVAAPQDGLNIFQSARYPPIKPCPAAVRARRDIKHFVAVGASQQFESNSQTAASTFAHHWRIPQQWRNRAKARNSPRDHHQAI